MSRMAIIGAGAWGTGLSIVLGRGGRHQVRLWAHEPEVRDSIFARRVNELFLPGQSVPESVSPTGRLAEALEGAEIVVSVMPSQHCRHLFTQMRPHLRSGMLFVSATKGLEEATLLRMTEVIAQIVGSEPDFAPRVGALSGPSFAREVARGDPTAITIASEDAELTETVQREFSDARFRVWASNWVAHSRMSSLSQPGSVTDWGSATIRLPR
jgi:glycerol-3-phosphate dehydrogenase (NAD(P)+)